MALVAALSLTAAQARAAAYPEAGVTARDVNADSDFTSESLGGYVETWGSLAPHFKRFIDGKDD
jgi:hypothetical protein